MIGQETKQKISSYLSGFLRKVIDKHWDINSKASLTDVPLSKSVQGAFKPFHDSLLPETVIRISRLERSFSTSLGTTFEECARLIALENHVHAKRQFQLEGETTQEAVNRIDQFVSEIELNGLSSNFLGLVDDVVECTRKGTSITIKVISDLYVQRKDGSEVYFELKSPKPNKGQCLEATRRQLRIHALTRSTHPEVRAYFAFPYNPYGIDRSTYAHSFALKCLDLEQGVLIGEEFWKLVGGPDAYLELLDIYQNVGKEFKRSLQEMLKFEV